MARPRRRDLHTPGSEPVSSEGRPSTARPPAGDEDERRSLQAVAAYLRILQEWSVEAQLKGPGGDQSVVSRTAPKIRKRR
jgi:hypothetical protein